MDWLRENWFWIAVFVFFIWMHRGHGGHGCGGGHGSNGTHSGHGGDDASPDDRTGEASGKELVS